MASVQQQQQQQQQPPTAAQQQQQQLVRPEDGELGMVVAQVEKHLSQKEGALTTTTGDQQQQQQNPSTTTTGTPSSRAFSSLVSASSNLETFFPSTFIAAIKDHFNPEKLKLSDEASIAVKDEGNKLFQAQRFDEAVLSFTKAMLSVKSDETYAVLLGNRSAAFFSAGMTLAAALDTNFALSTLKPSSLAFKLKLLDRRTRCLASLGFTAESEKDGEVCKQMMKLVEEKKDDNDEEGKKLNELIADRSDVLVERQRKVIDPRVFCSGNSSANAKLHPELTFSMDKQALPYSATDSFRRFASLKKVENNKDEKQQDDNNNNDILTELPTVACVRTDCLLVVCSMCCQRSSALYPSEEFRKSGFRCRGLFCGAECSELYWKKYGEKECGIPFYMASSSESVCALRLMNSCNDESCNQVPLSFAGDNSNSTSDNNTNISSLFSGLPDQIRPKLSPSSSWLVKENFEINAARSRETEPVNQAAFGGHESSVALIALILGNVFSSTKEATLFIDTYRKLVAFLQPIMFTDRIFQKNQNQQQGGSNNASKGQTHATIPVTCALGYYPITSLFNHSCDPNCHVTFRGNPFSSSAQLHIRLIKPVQEGQMLTISWGNVDKNTNHSTRSRIQMLRRLFGFSCICTACSQNPDEAVSRERQEMMIKAADYYQKGRRLIRERKDLPEAITVLKQSLEILFKFVCPPPDKPIFVVGKTYDAIAQASLLNGDSQQCVEYVKKRIDSLEELQGENNFEFVMELEKLSALMKTYSPADSDEEKKAEREKIEKRTVSILKRLYPSSISLQNEIDLVESA